MFSQYIGRHRSAAPQPENQPTGNTHFSTHSIRVPQINIMCKRGQVSHTLYTVHFIGTLDLRTCLNIMHPARSKWFHIGIQLGIESSTLRAIEHKWPKDDGENCLLEVLDEWLKQHRGSWETLIAALRAESVGEAKLADNLEQSATSWYLLCIHLYPKLQNYSNLCRQGTSTKWQCYFNAEDNHSEC